MNKEERIHGQRHDSYTSIYSERGKGVLRVFESILRLFILYRTINVLIIVQVFNFSLSYFFFHYSRLPNSINPFQIVKFDPNLNNFHVDIS